jgi:hypothetical protein
VEAARKEPRAIERPQVRHFLDDAERAGVAARVGADLAGVGSVDIAAGRAGLEVAADCAERGEQRIERGLALLEQMQHRAARRTGAEAGKSRQGLG